MEILITVGQEIHMPERDLLNMTLARKWQNLHQTIHHNISNGWSQTGMSFTDSEGIDYSGSKVLNIELYYNPKDYKEGDITVKVDSQDVFQEQMSAILGGKGVKQKNGMMQVDLSFEINSNTEVPKTENHRL